MEKFLVKTLSKNYPKFRTPAVLNEYLVRAVNEGKNQYGPVSGDLDTVRELVKAYSPKFGRELKPEETIVTCDYLTVYDAFFHFFMDPQDEFVCIGPAENFIRDKAKYYRKTLHESRLANRDGRPAIDWAHARSLVTERTKFVLLASPHFFLQSTPNKEEVFAELRAMSREQLCFVFDRRFDFLLDSDEPYAIPEDIFRQSLSIFSAGRAFNIEDWALGYAIGCSFVVKYLVIYALWMRFCPNVPAMAAFGLFLADLNKAEHGLSKHFKQQRQHFEEYFQDQLARLERGGVKGQLLNAGLRAAPLLKLDQPLDADSAELEHYRVEFGEERAYLFPGEL